MVHGPWSQSKNQHETTEGVMHMMG